MVQRWSFPAVSLILLMQVVLFPKLLPAQECGEGWRDVASSFVGAELRHEASVAARWVVASERLDWAAWKEWEWDRMSRRVEAMPEPVQERARLEQEQTLEALAVSVFTCQPSPTGEVGRYLVRIDPDGRSYRTLDMVQEGGDWFVRTGTTVLDAEQRRVVTAYWQAMDEGRWDEAEAWVARQALPRFRGFRLEVERFLAGSAAIAEAREQRAAKRAAEWEQMFIRAQVDEEGIIVVSAEFPDAEGLASELIEVDGAWRILHR